MTHKPSPRFLGFTLVEVLVTVTIVAVLMAIGAVSFTSAGRSSRDSKRKTDMEAVRQALVLYRADNTAGYPAGAGTNASYNSVTATLVNGGYLSSPVPQDPKGSGTNLYYYYSNSATSFCVCAGVEGTGNSTATNCPTLSPNTDSLYYCVKSP